MRAAAAASRCLPTYVWSNGASTLRLNATRCPFCTASPKPRLSLEDVRKRRVQLFDDEKRKQLSFTRIEKIKVVYSAPDGSSQTLLMNKGLSTPHNCAMHISELLRTQSAIAVVGGEPWDMHRPLESDCELRFMHFKEDQPKEANLAFWRSCSFMLGYIAETAFKDKYTVELCNSQQPQPWSGSFIYDVALDIGDWKPSALELNCLSRVGARLGGREHRFEYLSVDAALARSVFQHDRLKAMQIDSVAALSKTGSTITLYRLQDHVDMATGPMVSSTKLISRFRVTALHATVSRHFGKLTRMQGLALPSQLSIHASTFDHLAKRAAAPNSAPEAMLQSSAEM